MLSELRVWSLVLITGVIWLALAAASVVTGSTNGLSVIVDLLPLILLIAYAFERRGWRVRWLHPRWVSTPVVIGTWRGELTSFGFKPGDEPISKVVYFAIRQTLTTATVRLLSDESTSDQIAGSVTHGESNYPAIAYIFRGKPGIALRHKRAGASDMHYGGGLLEIVADPAVALKGEYWTDRKTKGNLFLQEHAPQIAQTYEEASKLTFGPPRPIGVFD